MKFCYCDESGTGDEPIAVMVGIIVDAQRMHLTKKEWIELLHTLSELVKKPIDEIHARDFYPGNGIWRGINGSLRSKIITAILDWIADRKHHIVISAINKSIYFSLRQEGKLPKEINTLWRTMGLHIILAIQKAFKNNEVPKGNTVFVFDNEEKERVRFTDLIMTPPVWTDTYYNKGIKEPSLNQIVDVPYFGDSKEVSLIQVADFVAFFVRRYIELKEGLDKLRYAGEDDNLENWAAQISSRSIGAQYTYPQKGRCDCANLFYQLSPETVRHF